MGEINIQKQAEMVEATSQSSLLNKQYHKQETNPPPPPLQFPEQQSEIIQMISVQDSINEAGNQNHSPVNSGDIHVKVDSEARDSSPTSMTHQSSLLNKQYHKQETNPPPPLLQFPEQQLEIIQMISVQDSINEDIHIKVDSEARDSPPTSMSHQSSLLNKQYHKQETNPPLPLLQFPEQQLEIIQMISVQDSINEDIHITVDSEARYSPPTREISDWAIPTTSLAIEGVSAVLDQLNYLLPGLVLAFVALLVSVVDLIYIAQREGLIKKERSSCLSCCFCHLNDNSPTVELFIIVQWFGLTSALWQLLYSTLQYIYAPRHLDNPIRMNPLPFLFLLCVLISKSIRLRRKTEEINCRDLNRSIPEIEP